LGHRGARHAAPENTLEAFDLAMDEGADGVELDVRRNASGEPMVCHDVDLQRVTEGRDDRRIADLSTAECGQVQLANGARLPRLVDTLDWARKRGACVNVELKMDTPLDASLVISAAGLCRSSSHDAHLLVSSFKAAAVALHRVRAPEIASAWLFESATSAQITTWVAAGAAAVHPAEALVDRARLAAWHARGLRVHCWTVNAPQRAKALADLGVDALICDNPGLILNSLG
jgi:glycerophosphoryl diester phosphodiesterase